MHLQPWFILLTGSFNETIGFSSHFHPWLNPISWLIFLIAFWIGCMSRLVAKHQRTHRIRITRWIWDDYCWNLMDFTYVSFIYFYMCIYIDKYYQFLIKCICRYHHGLSLLGQQRSHESRWLMHSLRNGELKLQNFQYVFYCVVQVCLLWQRYQ